MHPAIVRCDEREVDGVRVVIAGFGGRSTFWLAACRAERVDVAGVADPSAGGRGDAARQGLRTWESLEAALEDPWDAAIVASHDRLHLGDVRTCIAAGRPSVVERPVATSWRDVMALARESREAGVPVLVAQYYRFIRREVVLRRLLAQGVVGRALRVTVASTLTRQPYLRSPDEILWHFGIHQWDALRTRFGGPPDSIHMRPLPEVSAGTSFGASLVWEGGPEVSYLHHDGTDPMGYHEWVGCETGSLVVLAERVFVDQRGTRLRRVWRPRRVDADRPFLRGLEAAVAGRPPGDLGIRDNLQTIAMLEAARRSIASGEPARVGDVLAEASDVLADGSPTRPPRGD